MIKEILISFFVVTGSLFILVASIGLLRMPDIYTRMHAATKATSWGIMLILFGVMIYYPSLGIIMKSLLIIIFLYLTTPVAANLLGKTSLEMGLPVWLKKNERSEKGDAD